MKKSILKQYRAFTLSGILMSVLVISVVLVALAPVISKRINDSLAQGPGSQNVGVLFRIDKNDDTLTRCNITSDTDGFDEENCTFQLPEHVSEINAVVVGFGGKGSDAIQEDATTHYEAHVGDFDGSATTVTIPTMVDGKFVSNPRVEYMVSGGAGGGAGYVIPPSGTITYPSSQADCDQYFAVFVPDYYTSTGNNSCMSKRNAGDAGGPPLTFDYTPAGSSCTAEKCCWVGQTADSATCTPESGLASSTIPGTKPDYESCNRTVCNWNAASEICAKWTPGDSKAGDWRLINQDEVGDWREALGEGLTYELGANGLQACASNDSGEYLPCKYSFNCIGATGNRCYPFVLWATSDDLESVNVIGLGNGGRPYISTYYNVDETNDAFSVRCLYDPQSKTIVNAGAGGGAGADSYNDKGAAIPISNGIVKNPIELTLTLGKGGNGASNSASTAQLGGATKVVAKDTLTNQELLNIEYGMDNSSSGTEYAIGKNGTEDGPATPSSSYKRYSKTGSSAKKYFNIAQLPSAVPAFTGDVSQVASGFIGQYTGVGGTGAHSNYVWAANKVQGITSSSPTYSGGGTGGSVARIALLDTLYNFPNSTILQALEQRNILTLSDDFDGLLIARGALKLEPTCDLTPSAELVNCRCEGDTVQINGLCWSEVDNADNCVGDAGGVFINGQCYDPNDPNLPQTSQIDTSDLADAGPNDGRQPGAGGGGGAADVSSDGTVTGSGGGQGAPGAVVIAYDLIPPAKAGGGGAGGGMVVGKNIAVNADLITVSFNPEDLGVDANGCTYVSQLNIGDTLLYAWCGGNASASTLDAGGFSLLGGEIVAGGGHFDEGREGEFEIYEGLDGLIGGEITDTAFVFGGAGGGSGATAVGACGAFSTYTYADGTTFVGDGTCMPNVDPNNLAAGSSGIFNPTLASILSGSYGPAGAGGGGGGYGADSSGNPLPLGTGSDGADGYVYIWWVEEEE